MNRSEGVESPASTALVLGASGQQGGAVARALASRGLQVRAATRAVHSRAMQALKPLGIQPVTVDLRDAASIAAAMRGADLVFSVQPSSGQPGLDVTDEQEVEVGRTVIESAEREGVGHLVYSSALAAVDGPSGIAHFDTKVEIESILRDADLTWTIVRPATFMKMVVDAHQPTSTVQFLMPAATPIQLVAVEDIGRTVAHVASDGSAWGGRAIDLAGDSVDGDAIAASLATQWGRPVRYEQLDVGDPDSLLSRLAESIESGPLGLGADVTALRAELPWLLTFREWLARQS